jgi:hypothetical protein
MRATYNIEGPSTPTFTRRGRCVRDLPIPSKNDKLIMDDQKLSQSDKRSQQGLHMSYGAL